MLVELFLHLCHYLYPILGIFGNFLILNFRLFSPFQLQLLRQLPFHIFIDDRLAMRAMDTMILDIIELQAEVGRKSLR